MKTPTVNNEAVSLAVTESSDYFNSGNNLEINEPSSFPGPSVELRYGLLALTVVTIFFAITTNLILIFREAAADTKKSGHHHHHQNKDTISGRRNSQNNNLRIPIFITILAVDDLTIALLNGALVYNATIDDSIWRFGEFLCRIKEPLLQGVVGISCTLMMVIAAERWSHMSNHIAPNFNTIHRTHSNLYRKLSPATTAKLQAFLITGAVVTGHLFLAVPFFLNAQYMDLTKDMPVDGEASDEIFCVQEWQSAPLFVIYRCVLLVVTFLIPLTGTLILHLKIIHHVHVMLRRTSINQENLQTNQSRMRYLLIGVVISFAVCWIPSQLVGMFMDIKTSGLFEIGDMNSDILVRFWRFVPIVMSAFRMLIIVQAGVNPLLYGRNIQRYQTTTQPQNEARLLSITRKI